MTEKFMSPEPLPTEYEREILTILIEECAEVQQRATKLLRFGRDEVQPGQALSNRARLGLEIGDLLQMIEMAENEALITGYDCRVGMRRKMEQLAKFMQTSKARSL